MTSTSHAKNISLVQWFLIDLRWLLRLSRRPDDKHISCQKYFTGPMVSHRPPLAVAVIPRQGDEHISCQEYFTGPMVSHRVEDQTSSEATSVPSWKWKGWAESIHALLEQKTLFAPFTPNCGAQMVPVLKGVYQAESGEGRTPHSFRVGRDPITIADLTRPPSICRLTRESAKGRNFTR
jgi:hypothetical protein